MINMIFKRKKVNFLFIYEVKPREIESISLLGYELQRRGYSVDYVNTWHCLDWIFKRRISAEVVIIYAAYNTATVDFALDYVKKFEKVVNLQWEQLLSVGQKDDKTKNYYIQGKAEQIIHFSWGQDNYKRLVEDCSLKPENVKIVGHVGMDFLRLEFKGYYKSRKEICEKYHLPQDKKICLFISSFSYVNIPEIYVSYVGEYFVQVSNESQKIVLQWFEKVLSDRDDVLFIYRPHPAEADNIELLEMEKRVSGFRVISEYSVKQWITIADQVYNWYSTSLMEVFCAKKSCYILRPIKIPEQYEIEIFQTADFIDNYNEFAATIDKEGQFPISDEEMYKYYYVEDKEPAYLRAASELEEVYHNKDYVIAKGFHTAEKIGKRQVLKATFLGKIYLILSLKIKKALGSKTAAEELYFKEYSEKLKKQNYASGKEIKSIMNKIDECLTFHW